VARARARRKLSLNEVARAAHISPSVLLRMERGERANVRLTTAIGLCEALGLSLDALFGLRARQR